jgi:transcriptional regulator with XRE-family HTH domain
MDIRKVFGLNMRRLRIAAGFSQEAAAEIIGVGRSHASSMERGQQNVTILVIWHVAEALGCKAADLLDETTARTFAASLTTTKAPRKRRRSNR